MDTQPTLQNDKIQIRPLREEDFDALYRVASDPLIWEQHQCKDRHEEDVFRKLFQESIESKGALVLIDKATNEIIGSSRYKQVASTDDAVEIGWTFISRDYWGTGYNPAMKRLMLDHAFKTMDDVVFYVNENNIRSQKAVGNIGGKRITDLSLKHLIKDEKTTWTFRINKEEWARK